MADNKIDEDETVLIVDAVPPFFIKYGEKYLQIQKDAPGYRFKIITNEHGHDVLLSDDGCRIKSLFISDKPINPPKGEREWELLWEYKHETAPGVAVVVALIMSGAVDFPEI